jgi:rhodanese-related sulfurtransferase
VRRKMFRLAPALLLLAAGATVARAQGDERITVDEFRRLVAKNAVVVLDVRNEEIERKIKGALHLPYNDIEARAKELPRDREIVTYCA